MYNTFLVCMYSFSYPACNGLSGSKIFFRITSYTTGFSGGGDIQLYASPSGRSLAGIVGSNPTGGMDICLLWVSCVVR